MSTRSKNWQFFPDEPEKSSRWSSFKKHPKTKHCLSLVRFFSFRIVQPTMDLSTDVQTAQAFFNENHFYWGISTLAFVLMPFVARVLILIFQVAQIAVNKKDPDYPSKWFHIRWFIKKSQILWHLPPINILRWVLGS